MRLVRMLLLKSITPEAFCQRDPDIPMPVDPSKPVKFLFPDKSQISKCLNPLLLRDALETKLSFSSWKN
jgi:hypothetical protein